MRSVFLMALKNIKKKKLQNLLIALIICVSSLTLATGIGLIQNFDSPVEKMFTETKASHDILSYGEGMYNTDDLTAWIIKQPNVQGVISYKAYGLSTKVSFNGKKVDKSMNIIERPDFPQAQDKLIFVEGTEKNSPGSGEMWIPTSFAYENGIKLGDRIEIPTNFGDKSMKVTAIVVDPSCSSPLIGTVRGWVEAGEIQKIFNSKNNLVVVGVRYKDLSKAESTWKDIETYFKGPFGGYRFDYTAIKYCYDILLKIAASVLISFSIVVIICSIFIISFTISNSILGDFKVIGILKSQGFTSKQIQFIYQLQFLLLSIISIPAGVCLSYVCTDVIMTNMLKATGINNVSSFRVIPAVITFLVIFIVIVCTTFISSMKTSKIKPSDALKAVTAENISNYSSFINLLSLKGFSTSFGLAVKQMVTYKRQVLFIGITLFLVSLVFSGTVNCYNSVLKLGSNLPYWGFENSQVTFQFIPSEDEKAKNEIINDIKKDNRVVNVVSWLWSSGAYKDEQDTTKVLEIVPYGGDMDSIGIINIEGRNPRTADEVSLAVNTSKDMKKSVGDSVDIYFKGSKKSFIVTGIYQSMIDGGEGARVQRKAIDEYIDKQEETMYAVKLKDGENSISFAKSLSDRYGSQMDVKQTAEVYKSFTSAITGYMAYAVMFLMIIFAVITFIIIFNVTLITIYQQKKELGIFKALGMLNLEIRSTIVYRVLLSSLIGMILGVPSGMLIVPKLLNMILAGAGLVNFPFVMTGIGTAGVIMLCIVIVFISVWVASGRVILIKLNNLINE